MKTFCGIIFSLLFLSSLNAQVILSGNLHQDSQIISSDYNNEVTHQGFFMDADKKSPLLGGLFSLIIPGAGELYAESYLKAAIFAAAEAIIITTAIVYDKKGDDQTEVFENYADENWSVVRYAEWINEYQDGNISIDNTTPGLQPWERVNWEELNANEHGSHKLPPHGDQQYYELIGKYYQYSSGWDDYTSGANNPAMSPNFHFYSGMRGQANDYYNVATKAVVVLYINHFLSMLDGAWSAVQFNNDLALNVRVQENPLTWHSDLMPTLNLQFNF